MTSLKPPLRERLGASGFRRHSVIHVGALTAATLWSGGSSYLLFVMFARTGARDDLGKFVAASSLALLVTQLLDGGSGVLMIRDVSQLAGKDDQSRRINDVGAARARALLLAIPVVIAASYAALDLGVAATAVTTVYVAAAVAYAFVLQIFQARQRFRSLTIYQFANGVTFIAIGAAITASSGRVGLVAMVAAPAASYVLLATIGLTIARLKLKARSERLSSKARNELRAVRGGAFATAISGTIDQLLLGAAVPVMAAEYAGAQRAALVLSALSLALMNVLLPRMAAATAQRHAWVVHKASHFFIPVAVVSFGLGLLLSMPLRILYGDPHLAPPVALACLMSAYALGALSSLPVTVLYALKRGALVASFSIMQSVIVVAGCAVGVALRSTTAVALAVFAGKAAYTATTIVASRRLLALK